MQNGLPNAGWKGKPYDTSSIDSKLGVTARAMATRLAVEQRLV